MNTPQSFAALFGLCATILIPYAAQASPSGSPGASLSIYDDMNANTMTVDWSFGVGMVFINNVGHPGGGSITFNKSVVNTISFSAGAWWWSGGLTVPPTYVDFYEDNTLTTVSGNLVYSAVAQGDASEFYLTFTSTAAGSNPLLPQPGATMFVKHFDSSGLALGYHQELNPIVPPDDWYPHGSLGFSVTSTALPVPEPSTIAFGFLGALLGFQRLRRLNRE